MRLTNKILNAAMASSQHVFVSYSPHVNTISVYAHRPDVDWADASDQLAGLLERLAEILEDNA